MARTRLGLLNVAPALAVLSVGLAAVAVSDPSSHLAVALIGLLGIVGTTVLARFQGDPERILFLRNLMLLGVAIRFFVFSGIHQTVGPYVFAPDQFTYEGWGMGLMRTWTQGAPMPSRLSNTLRLGYPIQNAVLFVVFGFAKAAPAALNIFFSVWTAIPIYHLIRRLTRGWEKVARWGAGLTLFFPSMVLWSTMNIREAPTILVVVLAVYFFVRLQARPDPVGLAGVVIMLALLTLLREYLTSLVGIAGVAGMLMGQSRSPLRALAVGLVLIFGLTVVGQSLGLGSSLVGDPSLEQAQVLRENFQLGAGSAYGEGADVSTPGGAVLYLPVGLAFFLLAPFPWAIGSLLQAITLPETLLWWGLLPFGIWGAFLALRRNAGAFTVPFSVFVVVTFAYAMVESNVGTAYRHRAQILPLAFIFCAIGIVELRTRWARRRAREAERRRRAAASVQVPFPPRRP